MFEDARRESQKKSLCSQVLWERPIWKRSRLEPRSATEPKSHSPPRQRGVSLTLKASCPEGRSLQSSSPSWWTKGAEPLETSVASEVLWDSSLAVLLAGSSLGRTRQGMVRLPSPRFLFPPPSALDVRPSSRGPALPLAPLRALFSPPAESESPTEQLALIVGTVALGVLLVLAVVVVAVVCLR